MSYRTAADLSRRGGSHTARRFEALFCEVKAWGSSPDCTIGSPVGGVMGHTRHDDFVRHELVSIFDVATSLVCGPLSRTIPYVDAVMCMPAQAHSQILL